MTRRFITNLSDGQQVKRYLTWHLGKDMFLGLPNLDPHEVARKDYGDVLEHTAINADNVLGVNESVVKLKGFRDGDQERSVKVWRVTLKDAAADNDEEEKKRPRERWILQPNTGDSEKAPIYDPQNKIVLEKSGDGYTTTVPPGITIGRIRLQLQQKAGIEAFQSTNKTQALVYATGTGKSFVLIAPAVARGGGVFIVPDDKQAKQLAKDIRTLDQNFEKGDLQVSTSISKGQEATVLAHKKYVIIKKDDVERFLPHLKHETIAIDEVHEVDPEMLRKLKDMEGTTLQMVTATWTNELQKLFGTPMTEINMHYALNELKAFRNVKADAKQFTKGQKADDRVFEMVADYYGSITYIDSDNQPEKNKHRPRYATTGSAKEVLLTRSGKEPDNAEIAREVRKTNEIRRYDHMNMAFTKDRETLDRLSAAYQAVFDGDYDRLDKLAVRVSEMRAAARIREEWKPVPDRINLKDKEIKSKYADIIRESAVTAEDLQKEAQLALQQKIASVITRKVVGIFKGNMPPEDIGYIERSGRLKENLEFYTDKKRRPELDDRQRGFIDAMRKNGTDSNYTKIYTMLEGVKNRDAIMKAIEKEEFTALQVDPAQIDMEFFKAKGASYATKVKPGDSTGAEATAERLNEGLHVHTVGDSELATGYSNPDILSVQRYITKNIKEAIIRATQMIGRCVRAKDGIAFATDYLSHTLDMARKLGEKGGRAFLMLDTLKENYGELVKEFHSNFERTHKPERPKPRDEGADMTREGSNTPAKHPRTRTRH